LANKCEAEKSGLKQIGHVMKIKHIALGISVFGFVIGFSELQDNMFFWLGKPVGAISFIAFYIFMLLEKEYALFDADQRVELKISSGNSQMETCAPALTTAPTH
jgi:hypothetical protein